MPANSTGPRTADTQNHLVRTRSTNSRRMIAQTLCTVLASGRGRGGSLRPHEVHEDLVQRGTGQLKAREARARRHEALEDFLRIRSRCKLELRLLPKVLDLGHESQVREYCRVVPLTQ